MDKSKQEKTVTREDAFSHLRELIADIKVTMMSTVDKDGTIRSRPMMTQDSADEGCLWFFSADHHGKADELESDPRTNLSYAMPEKNRYVSVSGLGEIVHDLAKKKELWKPIYKAWFPEGVEDPHCALIKVYVEKAEFWDVPSSKFVELVGFTKAVLTGKTYKPSEQGHDRIEFQDRHQNQGL